ncbi:putative cell wall-binding protein/surface antigen [Cryobacterium sp. MP_M5]|uniref:cell wall-binding repeat-containing protein n=1 Tax=unclassified Cryobacterium TaxID=2649013 RepID=UPI0018CB8D72|nr:MULTISPECIES: cell wall-binding repeat-containing protein [unclassified Cryobacterium]MBG6058650.1 putative cell wall-binding protein/surface antigen [Cryobacterium sp. MP_M3]MEC5177288.1 putative cell wall-binding protein/surface antigen [Cryobacterium sp. MP_M5]
MEQNTRGAALARRRLSVWLQRTVSAAVAFAVVTASTLVFSPVAFAGTDDYPAQWRDVPQDSVFDTWREYNRECTSFAAWRLHSRNGFEMPFYDDASGWGADALARGYTVDMNPTVGSIAWWSYGHLAWVESVNAGGTVTVEAFNWRTPTGHDGAYHESTYAASAVSGYIHFKDAGSGLHSGAFVIYRGDIYRLAGGAPLYVSGWAPFGGPQPVITLSDAQWASLRRTPADGTFVAAQPSAEVFEITGGAPRFVSSVAGFAGGQPTVTIGDDDIRNAGTTDQASPWSHLRARLSGADRFATSAAVSAAGFSPGVPVAYIANGLNFPDALSAAPVAGRDGAPVLLVQPDGIPAPIQAELTRLKPGRIVVVGSEVAVGAAVATQLATLTAGGVTRLSGPDRFATSAAISTAGFAPGVPVAYVASGLNFPDALSAAPLAGRDGAPVLLVQPDGIPSPIQAELARLHPGRIVLLGAEAAVSAAVATQLASLTAGGVTRISGPDRFATSAAISAAGFAPGVPVVYLANGLNFPDALSAAPVAGNGGVPVLLVQPDGIPAPVQAELARLKPTRIIILGAEAAVSSSILP